MNYFSRIAFLVLGVTYLTLTSLLATTIADIEDSPVLGADFIEERYAWVVNRSAGNLLYTTDGGKQWNIVHGDIIGGFGQVSFVDKFHGWAIGGRHQIWATKDGGKVWEYLSILSPDKLVIRKMKFIDRSYGWFIDSSGRFGRTIDGGRNWRITSIWKDYQVEIFGFSYLSPKIGWLACDKGVILKTEDGGNMWRHLRMPTAHSVYDIFFIDSMRGWALVGKDIYHTNDGGETWQAQIMFKSFYDTPFIISLFFLNRNIGWCLGQSITTSMSPVAKGVIFNTSTGGQRWVRKEMDEAIYQIHFSTRDHGWLISLNKIYRTSDGGKSWKVALTNF